MAKQPMILEVAILNLRPGTVADFEQAFTRAQAIIASMPGYLSHDLRHCIESPEKYILLVQWQTLESHTVGFRGSPQYQEWKRLLHDFYDPFPTVEHYAPVAGVSSEPTPSSNPSNAGEHSSHTHSA